MVQKLWKVFQKYFKRFSIGFQKYYKNISKVFQKFKRFEKKFLTCTMYVLRRINSQIFRLDFPQNYILN